MKLFLKGNPLGRLFTSGKKPFPIGQTYNPQPEPGFFDKIRNGWDSFSNSPVGSSLGAVFHGTMAHQGVNGMIETFKEGKNIKPIYKMASTPREKIAFLGSVAKGLSTAGTALSAYQGVKDTVNNLNKGNKIQAVNKTASNVLEKKAFLGTLSKGLSAGSKMLSTVANSKIVNSLGGFKGWAGSAALEHFTGKFKQNRDNAFMASRQSNNNVWNRQNNFQKTSSILDGWGNFLQDSINSIYSTQNDTLKNMAKQGAFDLVLKQAALADKLKPFTDAAKNISNVAFAGSTLASLNNSRKNIQYAAPKVHKPI